MRRTDGLEHPSGIHHAEEGRSCSPGLVGQILDLGSRRPAMGSTAAGGSLDAEAVAVGRSLGRDIGCSLEADYTVDRRTNRRVLTF
jgi:hypothetical protein